MDWGYNGTVGKRSLQTPEDLGSNLVIQNFMEQMIIINCRENIKMKKIYSERFSFLWAKLGIFLFIFVFSLSQ